MIINKTRKELQRSNMYHSGSPVNDLEKKRGVGQVFRPHLMVKFQQILILFSAFSDSSIK